MVRGWTFILISGLLASLAWAQDKTWELSWEDDFERSEVGPNWEPDEKLSIKDGWLYMKGRVDAHCQKSFKPDIKVEFRAKSDPEAPPCDLAIILAGHHLLAFGGQNNQINQIIGGGVRVQDHAPAMLIEPGKVYKLVAVKEGPRLAYYADDQLLVEATVSDPLGGPGFDRFSLLTWKGMYVDYVKVYERTTPAPGGPTILTDLPDLGFKWDNRELSYTGSDELDSAVEKGIELYNKQDYQAAINALEAVSPPTLHSVAALAYVIADLDFQETVAVQKQLADLAREVADRDSSDEAARDFAQAAEWFARINFRSRDHRATQRLIEIGPEDNPFYYKAKLFETRYNYAHAIEGARRDAMRQALDEFKKLKEIWPDNLVLREWTGDQIPWGQELIKDEDAGPAWARYLQETLARQSAILNWWFTERQAPDGSLGGGWGDDVELLRTWVPVACITTGNESVIAGIERLADGVWKYVLEDGYDKAIGDVEHSAEPSCDSMPTMILLRYGDPIWLERNLRSAKSVRERFMGVNERGFLHFISVEFGMDGVRTHVQAGGDTGYHARATKHFIWLAWYGVTEARDVFLKWCEGWLDVTMREIGNKPAGFVPPTVWYPSGSISAPNGAPWYDEETNYYGFPSLPGMVHESFLTAYFFNQDHRYLDAIATMMDMATKGPLARGNPDLPRDAKENLLAVIAHQAARDTLSIYRWLTGERVYDEYILRGPRATQRYQITHDLDQYTRTFEGMAKGLRNNWLRRTQEVLQTDRAGMYGAVDVLGAYSGAVASFRDSKTPTIAVTYITPDLEFAAMVTETQPERIRVRLYQFHDEPMRVGIRPWRLEPGRYVLNQGNPVPGEREGQNRYAWLEPREVEHLRKGTPIWVDVPPGKEWVVDLRLREAIDRPATLPDLAIAEEDVKIDSDRISLTVHNIGNAKASKFSVAVQEKAGQGWNVLDQVRVGGMDVIKDFMPVRKTIELKAPANSDERTWRIVVDPGQQVDELYELNNTVTFNNN